jgi:entry exclusion lipoprotein TrbK
MVMSMARRLAPATAVALAAVLCACSPRSEPEVPLEANDANCRLEYLRTLPQEQRESLAGKCFRRGTFKPSEPRNW